MFQNHELFRLDCLSGAQKRVQGLERSHLDPTSRSCSRLGFSPSLWPRGAVRHMRCYQGQHQLDRDFAIALAWCTLLLSCKFHLRDHLLPNASHVVDSTLGSHAFRIGSGGAWGFYFNSSWNDSPFELIL